MIKKNKKAKIIGSLILLALLVVAFTWLFQARSTEKTDKLSVTASFYPLYDFASKIGGDKAKITNMTPAGAEPHDYEPSPKDLANAHQASLFVYNGAQFEPWTEGFLQDYKNATVKASDNISLSKAEESDHDPAEGDHDEEGLDPHFWLDPVLAQQIAGNILDGFIKADTTNKAYYIQNASVLKSQLAELDKEFSRGLQNCAQDSIVVSHEALGYLSKRYNFEAIAIAGISPEEEPSPARLAEIAQIVKEKNIKYIFFESLVSPDLADTIAQETGAKTLVFDPIEGLNNEDQKAGRDYFSIQRQNLANLRTALACE